VRPFSALSPRVLLTLLAVPFALLIAGFFAPAETVALLSVVAVATLVGGVVVALQSRYAGEGATARSPGTGRLAHAALTVFAAGSCLLVLMAAPGLYFKDAGELAASAHVLGVAHPTGFPLFCLAGKGFDLVPLGNAFFRLNLLSAVMMSAAAATAFFLVGRIWHAGRSETRMPSWVLLAAPASFLASHAVWLHGTTTEVYALSTAGLAGTVCVFVAATLVKDGRLLLLGWFLVGLGAGGHVTWPLYGGLTGLAVSLWPARGIAGGSKGWIAVPLVVLVGALAVLYLPVAASRGPVMNWGDPADPAGLWAHLSGERIRNSFTDQVVRLNGAALLARASMAGSILWQGTGPIWPLALVGLFWCGRCFRWLGIVLGAILLADLVFAAWVNPMGTWDLQTLVSGTWVLSVLAALGLGWLWRMARGRKGRLSVAGLAVLALTAQVWMSGADRDMTPFEGARETSSRALTAGNTGASLLATSDTLSAGLAALQAVENARPDALVLVKAHLADTPYVTRQVQAHRTFDADDRLLRTLESRPFESRGEGPQEALDRLLKILAERGPVFVEPGESRVEAGIRSRLLPGFPMYRLMERDVSLAGTIQSSVDAMSAAQSLVPGCDRWGRSYLGVYLRMLGTHVARSGAGDERAIGVLLRAASLNPGDSRTLQNLGILVFHQGNRREGLDLLRQSVAADAAYVKGWETLARYTGFAGYPDLKKEALDRLEALAR